MRIIPRTVLALCLAATLALSAAHAQGEAPGATTPAPAPTPAPTPAPAPAAVDPLAIRLEIYRVSWVTRDDGTREERFTEITEARIGQTIEYRLVVTNVTEDEVLVAGTVIVAGPVPEGFEFVPDSATPSSDDVLTEYSADGGESFAEPPVIVGSGENRSVAEPTTYDMVRWTLLIDLEPGQEVPFVYRVVVR